MPRWLYPTARGRGRRLALGFLAWGLIACSSEPEPEPGASDSPCGAPPGDWQYVLSCDSELATNLQQCIDYYATSSFASVAKTTFGALCGAMKGTVLSAPCPSEGSIGSCTATASSGQTATSPAAVLERQYFYGGNTSPDSYRKNCEEDRGIYTPPGDAASLPAGSRAGSCGGEAGPEDSSSGVAFSVSTVLNGEVLSCTNYVGEVSEEQLQAVLSQGAETAACPVESAVCGCAVAGVFQTEATIVYYRTSMRGTDACPNDDSSCGPYDGP
jgi:hypothetical protein